MTIFTKDFIEPAPHHESRSHIFDHVAFSVFPTQAEAKTRYYAIFGTRTRFILMAIVLLCLTIIWSNIITFNFAIICMVPDNKTTDSSFHEFSTREESIAIAVVAASALVGNFPVVFLINKFGIRTIFSILGLLSGVATLLIPLAVDHGFALLLICRAFQGVAFASNFAVIGAFCAKWAYYKQSGLFVSVLVAFVQLSPAVTMPASGGLCHSLGWQSIFYFHGGITIFLFLLYLFAYRNSPHKHPLVGEVERDKISRDKIGSNDKKESQGIPYKAIIKTKEIWGIWLATLGIFTAVNTAFLYSPSYMTHVLNMPATETGISSAFPPLGEFFAKILIGMISDKMRCFSEVTKFRIFNTFSFVGGAIFLTILGFIDPEHKKVCIGLLTAAMTILGASSAGFFKAAPVLSKQYSHFVTGCLLLGFSFTMLIVPVIVNWLAPHDTAVEWRNMFLFVAVALCIANIIFVYLIEGEPCAWTKDDESANPIVARRI